MEKYSKQNYEFPAKQPSNLRGSDFNLEGFIENSSQKAV
jgi:hypothetical protein